MDVGNFIGGQSDRPDIRTMVCKEVARQVLNGLEILEELSITHNGRIPLEETCN